MGTIFSPTYTALTMGYSEVQLYHIQEVQWGHGFKEFLVENWNRFFDDCKNLTTQGESTTTETIKLC